MICDVVYFYYHEFRECGVCQNILSAEASLSGPFGGITKFPLCRKCAKMCQGIIHWRLVPYHTLRRKERLKAFVAAIAAKYFKEHKCGDDPTEYIRLQASGCVERPA